VTEIRQKELRLLLTFIKITLLSQSHEINKCFDKYFDIQHIIMFILKRSL